MKQKHFIRGLVSTATAAAALFSALAPAALTNAFGSPAVQAAEESKLPDFIANGNFEYPNLTKFDANSKIWTYTSTGDVTTTIDGQTYYSYDKEDAITDHTNSLLGPVKTSAWVLTQPSTFEALAKTTDQNGIFGWSTTATNGFIELINKNISSNAKAEYFSGDDGVDKAANGDQFAELAATESSSLYQSISSDPGSVLTWSLNHRARNKAGNVDNIMAVFIGPKQTDLTKKNAAANDIFKQMAQLLISNTGGAEAQNSGDSSKDDTSRASRKVYSVPVDKSTDINSDSVSLYKTDKCTEEWTCWLITTDTTAWMQYSGTYSVPEAQTETTLAFTSVKASSTDNDNKDYEGNCIDDVRFGVLVPFAISASANGSGYVICEHGTNSGTVTSDKPYTTDYDKDENITIYATPDEGANFLGAYITGSSIADEGDGFIDANAFKKDDNTYSYAFKITEPTNVQLLFAKPQANAVTITYDLNGGTYTGSEFDNQNKKGPLTETISNTNTYINRTEITTPSTTTATKLLYWEFVTYDTDGKAHVLRLNPDTYSLSYNGQTSALNVKGSQSVTGTDNGYDITLPEDGGTVIMRAIYSHMLGIESGTRYLGDDHVTHKDHTGGTITITGIEGHESVDDFNGAVEPNSAFNIKAEANPGYRIEAWFYTRGTQTATGTDIHYELQPTTLDTYNAKFYWNEDITIHVVFSEIPASPYLSAVAENEESAKTFADKDIKLGVYNTSGQMLTSADAAGYGGEQFGNTISTGFFKNVTVGEDMSEKLSGVWTVNVFSEDTLMKIADDDYTKITNALGITGTNNALINDSDKVAENEKGNIYAMPENAFTSRQLKLYTGSDTTVTGKGSILVGLVINDLYAPQAQAGFKLGAEKGSALDISNIGITSNDRTPYPKPDVGEAETQTID